MCNNTFSFLFNPQIVFLPCIPFGYDVTNYYDRQYMEVIKNRYFTGPIGQEVGDFVFINLVLGLAGDVIKRFFLVLDQVIATVANQYW